MLRVVLHKTVYFNDTPVTSETSAVHPGSAIGVNANRIRIKADVNDIISHTYTRVSLFTIDVIHNLFKYFCMSLYGSPTWG